MNLVLDFGNTRIKAGLFNGKELHTSMVFDSVSSLLSSNISSSAIAHCLMASVTNNHAEVFREFSSKFSTQIFTNTTPIPLKNLYKSALTLGSDRLAGAIGSFSFYPDQNVLTIDAGTCIKYNFVNANNEYIGGAISPGIPMRLRAMHHFTSALPLIEADKNYTQLIGLSTSESLLTGAQMAACCEVDEMINRYKHQFKNLQVVLTGGDTDYLSKQLKNPFFANQNLLLHGLNTILNFSLEK